VTGSRALARLFPTAALVRGVFTVASVRPVAGDRPLGLEGDVDVGDGWTAPAVPTVATSTTAVSTSEAQAPSGVVFVPGIYVAR